MRSLCIAILLLGCGQPSEAEAPEGSPDEPPRAAEFRSSRVQQAVEAASDIVLTRGFASTGESWRGFLVDHDSDVRETPMRAGTCYLVLGAASSAMRELNLRVFDSDGGEIVQDGTDGSMAALRFCPSQSGTYYVAVHASAGSGLFEVRTFRGPTGLDIRIDDLFREVAPQETARESR
ncbi:MAG TPA: hypothetical protein RMH99_16520 [Sandaracinaceae bacterium LLY-WYZ-13_1]|nr:hypothetical protein [Sandaracinaceae bacterium LLY-WYZ-13_1]